jgi:RNA polymerase sigma-70 factor (ECF subfamily)
MNPSDVQLPELLAADLDHHFHHLVQRYQPQLYAFLLRQAGSTQDAEDIVQEVLIRAYYALAGYPGERVRTLKLRAWLFKIALNTFYSPGWKSKLHCVPLDLSDDSVLLEMQDDGSVQPDLIAEDKERLRELEALVSTLPARYREAVNLYYFEGLSYQEIAELLSQPLGTVKSNVFRGIRLLRAALETQTR